MARTRATAGKDLFMKNRSFIRELSYSLIATALVVLLLLVFTPEIALPSLAVFAYVLLGAGIVLLVARKLIGIIQQERLRRSRVQCETCGWDGMGEQILRSRACPECDSDRLSVIEND